MKKTFLKSMVAAAVVGAAVALSSVAAFAATYTFNASDYTLEAGSTSKSISANENVGTDNFFTLNADSKSMTIDGNEWTSPSGTSYTQRLKLNGQGDIKNRNIQFTLTEDATVKIVGRSSSNGTVRGCQIYTASNEALNAEAVASMSNDGNGTASDTNVFEGVFSLSGGETYYIVGNIGDSKNKYGFNIYEVTVTTTASSIASTATAITDTNDYYAVDAANGATYIIHKVTDAEMSGASLALQSKTATVAPTTQVYTSVEFSDSSVLNASDIGATAIYAVKVTGTEGAAPTKTFTWVSE